MRLIALTANAMEGMREHFLECGFQDFIAKPLDRRELNQLLLRWVPEKYRQTGDKEKETKPLEAAAFQIDGITLPGMEMLQFFQSCLCLFLQLLYWQTRKFFFLSIFLPILLDIQMAQKDGIETLKEIRAMKDRADIPVIMLTGVEDKDFVLKSAKLGICDYILKPFYSDDL